jgi:serine/threonine protein kinase
MQRADDPLIGQIVADRYQILSLIGEGGMGRVYLAEHVRMGRKSAVKVINPALATTSDAISRFNREAANACKINHPNVAQVYDFGEMADGTLYLAMEYIEGETLDAIVAREGPLPARRAAHIAKQIADALYAAHHLDIVHRDLKPENVMIARHLDGTDWVKVVDFGIAKTMQRDGTGSQTVTTAGVSLGTPEYMSPEQLAGEKLDHRTDVYSLGLVLFNALTGSLPYPKVTSKETLVRRLTSRPRTLAEVRPDIAWSADLQRALDRALAPEVADRYGSVAEFGRDVLHAAEGGAVAPAAPARALSTAAAAPNVSPADEAKLDRPLAHRRALPWVIATAAVLVAITLLAETRARQQRVLPLTVVDSTDPAKLAVTSTGTSVPSVLPVPMVATHNDSTAHAAAAPHPAVPTPPSPAKVASPPTAEFATKLADSISRSVNGMRLSDLTRFDSIMKQIGPEIERAQRMAQGRVGAAAQRHYWLMPNGDSVAARPLPPDAPLEARSNAAAREIRAHIARMKQRFDSGDVRAARQEFVMAAGELPIMRDLDPDPEHTRDLQRELAQGVRDVVASCNRMRADSTLAPGIRCENFLAARFRTLRQQP